MRVWGKKEVRCPPPEAEQRWISDNLVRLVQFVFSLVLVQGLLLFREDLLDPLQGKNTTALVALFGVYITTILSWMDWHVTMYRNQYVVAEALEKLRLFIDLMIVAAYAYLLFTAHALLGRPRGDLLPHLAGYVIVFLLYALAGVIRRIKHGPKATRLTAILVGWALFAVLWLAYWGLSRGHFPHIWENKLALNFSTLAFTVGFMIAYRALRRRLQRKRTARKGKGQRIGIDIDGVLANQIDGLIPRIKERFGVDLQYDDVIDWRLPIDTSDIASEIGLALEDCDYVVGMKAHPGARECLETLFDDNRLSVVTARPESSRHWTLAWLRMNKLWVDDFINASEARKSDHALDILVDDYVGNILDFLWNTRGIAVLLQQPWNMNRSALTQWQGTGRLYEIRRLYELPAIVGRVAKNLHIHDAVRDYVRDLNGSIKQQRTPHDTLLSDAAGPVVRIRFLGDRVEVHFAIRSTNPFTGGPGVYQTQVPDLPYGMNVHEQTEVDAVLSIIETALV